MIIKTNIKSVASIFAGLCLSAPLQALEQLTNPATTDAPATNELIVNESAFVESLADAPSASEPPADESNANEPVADATATDRKPAEDKTSDAAVLPEAFIARIEQVVSGDLVVMLLPTGTVLEAHLAGLTAPAEGSYYYKQSRDWLRSQLQGQLVSVECAKTRDSTGDSTLDCVIFPDERQINVVSLYHGFSVCNGEGSVLHDAAYYTKYEDLAKANKSGLWNFADR